MCVIESIIDAQTSLCSAFVILDLMILLPSELYVALSLYCLEKLFQAENIAYVAWKNYFRQKILFFV